MGDGNGVFHGTSHAIVVAFGVSDVGPMASEVCVTITRREEYVFMVEAGVASLGA
jgi:hypothetical protein